MDLICVVPVSISMGIVMPEMVSRDGLGHRFFAMQISFGW